jgi:RNA polymerase sigma-70 factor (ECF subfamily)
LARTLLSAVTARHRVIPSPSSPHQDSCTAGAEARWFAEEVKPHEPALRAYLHRKYPGMADVDDVVQESFLKTFLAWQKGRLTSARGFLFTVAGNTTISLFRRRKFVSPVPVSELPALSVLEDGVDVHETVCGQEELALISEAIASLPERCRQVAVRRLLRGRDCGDIARELGISEQTVRVQLARAMTKCSQYLQDRGITGVRSP